MAEHKTVRLERKHLDAIEDMVDRGVVDNESEAHRALLSEGMATYGYAGAADTSLRAVARRAADATVLLTILWVGVTFVGSVGLRLWAVPMALMALALYGVDRVLKHYEPAVSERLARVVGGERA